MQRSYTGSEHNAISARSAFFLDKFVPLELLLGKGPPEACGRVAGSHVFMSRSNELQRIVDRYVGIPLAGAVGVFTRRRPVPRTPARIGIIQTTAIGDTILCSGLLAHLSATYPAAELHVFHGPSNEAAIALLPLDVTAHRCDFRNPIAAVRQIRACGLDILVDLSMWTRTTALVTRFSGSRFTVGFRSHRQGRGRLYARAVDHSRAVHETENLRALANVFAPLESYVPKLREDFPKPRLSLPYDRLILLHVRPGGSRAAAKSWPDGNWVRLAERLGARGYAIGFTGAPGDEDAIGPLIRAIGLPAKDCFSLAGKITLRELGYVLSHARLLITVDTGVLHYAAALDAPLVSLHGPTSARRWGALTPRAIGINAPHPAAGYIHLGIERHPQEGEIMATISVEPVFEAAMTVLADEARALQTL